MKQIPASFLTLIIGIVVTLLSLWIGQYNGLLPEQVSEQAPLVDNLFSVMLTIGAAIFFIVEGAIVFFAIRFRQRPGDEGDGSPVEGNIPLEVVWTAIPSIIVIALGIYSVQVYAEMGGFDQPTDPMVAHHHAAPANGLVASAIAAPLKDQADSTVNIAENIAENSLASEDTPQLAYAYGLRAAVGNTAAPDLVVNVKGLQYAWIFNYPDGGMFTAELHIPMNTDVQLNIEAQDVIHSFWMPDFRIKQDAIPGQMTQLRFRATQPGTYPVVCAELCGAYHGSMRTQVIVHPVKEFEQWVEDNRIAQVPESADPVDLIEALALNPADLTDSEFLEPYGHEMGVNHSVLAQLAQL